MNITVSVELAVASGPSPKSMAAPAEIRPIESENATACYLYHSSPFYVIRLCNREKCVEVIQIITTVAAGGQKVNSELAISMWRDLNCCIIPSVRHLSDGSPDGACDSAGDRSNIVKSNICFKSAMTEPSIMFLTSAKDVAVEYKYVWCNNA